MKLEVTIPRRQIVEQDNRALPLCKEVLERQDLAAVPQRILRKQAQFG